MRKVTISLDDETHRWARIKAAEADQSLSRFIATLLEKERHGADDYDVAMDRFFARPSYPIRSADQLPTREDVYGRHGGATEEPRRLTQVPLPLLTVDTAPLIHEDRDMRNVTISLNDETARWARIKAAEADQSLSRFISGLLEKERCHGDDYIAAMNEFFAIQPWRLRDDPSERYPTRDELYDRPRIR